MKRCPTCNKTYIDEQQLCTHHEVQVELIPNIDSVCSAKYVFLDIVGFTNDRSIEAQSDIVSALNEIVKLSVKEQNVSEDKIIFIPTGDGICIALLNLDSPFDIHLLIALNILKNIHLHNETIKCKTRHFEVRIGLNSHLDNLVTDINSSRNIAGAGISLASRIMGMADGSQILVGQSVYETLRYRERYASSFKPYHGKIKHGSHISVYQFTEEGHSGLNIDVPQLFKTSIYVEPKLTKFAAYYFAHAMKLRPFFLERISMSDAYPSAIVLWLLALNSVEKSEAISEVNRVYYETHKAKTIDVEKTFEQFNAIIFTVQNALMEYIKGKYLSDFFSYFEGYDEFRFINSEGIEKLKKEWPDIWDEFGFEVRTPTALPPPVS